MSLRDNASVVHDCSSPVFLRNTLWVDEHRRLSPAFQRNALCSYIPMMIQLSHKMFLWNIDSCCFDFIPTSCTSTTNHQLFTIARPQRSRGTLYGHIYRYS